MNQASYWIYLVHLPLVQCLQIGLGSLAWPALVKFGVVIVATFALTLASFAFVVRDTPVGAWLGARRAPAPGS